VVSGDNDGELPKEFPIPGGETLLNDGAGEWGLPLGLPHIKLCFVFGPRVLILEEPFEANTPLEGLKGLKGQREFDVMVEDVFEVQRKKVLNSAWENNVWVFVYSRRKAPHGVKPVGVGVGQNEHHSRLI